MTKSSPMSLLATSPLSCVFRYEMLCNSFSEYTPCSSQFERSRRRTKSDGKRFCVVNVFLLPRNEDRREMAGCIGCPVLSEQNRIESHSLDALAIHKRCKYREIFSRGPWHLCLC